MKISLQTTGLQKGLKKSVRYIKKFSKGMKSTGKNTKQTGSLLEDVFSPRGAVITGMGFLLKETMDFEHQMKRLGAVTGATEKDFELLQKQAFELSNATGISATKITESMEKMARFGFKAEKIYKVMPSVLAGTIASGEKLETILKVTEGVISEFGLSADDTGSIVDKLSKVSLKTRANISRMGEALKFAGPVAKQTGVEMEDLLAVTGLMINAGVEGGLAGRALRIMMSRLAADTNGARRKLEQLGVTVKSETGGLVPFSQLVGELSDQLRGMSKLERAKILKDIFGVEAMSGVASLIEKGPQDMKKLTKKIRDSLGVTDDVAKQILRSAKSNVFKLKQSLKNLGIQMELKFLPILSKIVDKFNDWVKAFDSLDPKTKKFIIDVGAMVISLLAFASAIALMTPALRILRGALYLLFLPFRLLFRVISSLGGVMRIARGAINFFIGGIRLIPRALALLTTPFSALIGIIGSFSLALKALGVDFDKQWDLIVQYTQRAIQRLDVYLQDFREWGRNIMKNIGQGITDMFPNLEKKVLGIINWLKQNLGINKLTSLGIEGTPGGKPPGGSSNVSNNSYSSNNTINIQTRVVDHRAINRAINRQALFRGPLG